MHVIYLFPHFTGSSGAGNVVLSTAKLLVERGVEVTIIAQEGREDIIRGYDNVRFEFVGGPLPKSLVHWLEYPFIYRRVRKIIDKLAPDIIFPHVFPANYWGLIYKLERPQSKLVWYCHEPSAFIHDNAVIAGLPAHLRALATLVNPPMRCLDVHMSRRCDDILVNSRFTAERAHLIYGIEPKVAYPGVDLNGYPCNQAAKEQFFFSAGRLTRFKNMDMLIRAVALLRDKGKKAELRIAGDGPEKGSLALLAKELGVDDQVWLMGELSRDDLVDNYARSLAVLFPSIGEPLGLIPLEAQASHTAVIAFNSGGSRETVVPGETGILLDRFSPEGLAEAMYKALDDIGGLVEMGQRGRERIESCFTWSNTIDKLMEAFNGKLNVQTASEKQR